MRTTTELLAKIKDLLSNPATQTRAAFLIQLLPFRHAKRFIRPDRVKLGRVGWEEARVHPTDARVLFVLKERQQAAWTAANSKNANVVMMCLAHFEMLMWFLGADHQDAHRYLFDRLEHYGKPQLVWLCEEYELGDWRRWDDGRWQMTVLNAALPAADALRLWRKRGLSLTPKTEPPPAGADE